ISSLGPQSQVLHPAEASVFVQSSIPSTRSAVDAHHKYRLLNYSSTKVPTGIVWNPPQVLVTNSHICGGNFQQARTITSYIPIPQISHIVAIASNKSKISMGNKEYGK